MGNVIFKFKRSLSQKLTLQGPIDVIVDDKDRFKVEPDRSLDTTLSEGSHTLKVFIFNQDKEMGLVNTKIDVHGGKYEVTYTYDTLSGNGKVVVTQG
ncbi:MAG: hypothetical protein LBV13_04355 [Methanomassiliicoccaceae archaeon]|jgi:hypothetical protein|nr:hypothetical protein [Methanomassiliicoccaceae archaeon]